MPAIDRQEVLRIAALAQLELSDDEVERLGRELGAILGYMEQLRELDLSGVPPTAHGQIEALPLREDVPGESLTPELALCEAPRTAQGGFAVPGFVDE